MPRDTPVCWHPSRWSPQLATTKKQRKISRGTSSRSYVRYPSHVKYARLTYPDDLSLSTKGTAVTSSSHALEFIGPQLNLKERVREQAKTRTAGTYAQQYRTSDWTDWRRAQTPGPPPHNPSNSSTDQGESKRDWPCPIHLKRKRLDTLPSGSSGVRRRTLMNSKHRTLRAPTALIASPSQQTASIARIPQISGARSGADSLTPETVRKRGITPHC